MRKSLLSNHQLKTIKIVTENSIFDDKVKFHLRYFKDCVPKKKKKVEAKIKNTQNPKGTFLVTVYHSLTKI